MKIIALLLARNEANLLPTYLSSVNSVVDEIVAIDDRSDDNTREVLLNAGAKVYDSKETAQDGWDEFSARQRLLELGREHGGTHFVCLDADEALSANFIPLARKIILSLQPGQKLVFRWPFLWKSEKEYVDDSRSEFTNLYKDFIFCDRSDFNFKNAFLHFGKTPGPNLPTNLIKVSDAEGVCLHFAYVDFPGALLRQAWYRCMELIKSPKNYIKINNRYYLPKQGKNFKTTQVPKSWLTGLELPKINIPVEKQWRFKSILHWFDVYGVNFFEPLQIWDLAPLKNEFILRTGRIPRSSKLHVYLQPVIKIKRKIFRLLGS
jgi:glycosyltransferase involved in cell wall biosynthesis